MQIPWFSSKLIRLPVLRASMVASGTASTARSILTNVRSIWFGLVKRASTITSSCPRIFASWIPSSRLGAIVWSLEAVSRGSRPGCCGATHRTVDGLWMKPANGSPRTERRPPCAVLLEAYPGEPPASAYRHDRQLRRRRSHAAAAAGPYPRVAANTGRDRGHRYAPTLGFTLCRRHCRTTASAQEPPHASPPPPRAQRADFMVGDTVAFTDQHLNECIGIIVRVNQKTRIRPMRPE